MKRRKFLQVGAFDGLSGGLVHPLSSFSRNPENPIVVKEAAKEVAMSCQYNVVVSGAALAGVISAIESGRIW